ncbi:FAD-dependent oxidoreductase [Pseudomonas sp. BCA14]|uniref:NAD(P)/FAD-dependent oxidoreductase n=1 Tax=unclassified Pseudomonas TaxID=196821 RepID=UPI00106DF23E|nr:MULTISPECIES: FAD-dependent oxidoreductase [unclassified Pseudomonas]TFF14207.1 FAD-dependent oxidoreductase [Pseudomonas sp. JMN1]TFF15109.1 FAD-dependent oxidoreductase [Pseudomonas sp. BCA17]TFF31516.1 FAD-dependent oxidoreductase [Pseudomonas sp. BCA14]TFF32469.1 FAD-dependent oxidoreductase [Pseudomonas sp. BCA13]
MENVCGWIAQAGESPVRDPLSGKQQADWLVIGAGITGLSAAHSIAELHPQARIVVVDRQRAAQGASARNSGFVVGYERPTTPELQGNDGFAGFQVDTSISRAASDEVRKRIARHGIECDLRESGYFFAVSDPRKLTNVEAKLQTLHAVGASAQFLQGKQLIEKLGTRHYQAAIWCGNGNALLQPAKYVKGLLDALPDTVTLFENTEITGLERLGNGRIRANGRNGNIEAKQVLICLNAFISRAGVSDSGTFAMELSASLTRPLSDEEFQAIGAVEPWGVLSTRPLGATVRLTPDRRVMIRNTAEYRSNDLSRAELTVRRQHHVLGLQRRFPMLGEQDIQYTWTGHLSASRSGQPYFAKVEEGVFAVAGCNGSGVARGTLWGRLLVELASGADSPILQSVIERAQPGWLPPKPFLDIGAMLRMRVEAARARSEV